MSAAEIDAGTLSAATPGGPDEISRRLESLPASSYVWRLVILLSLGGWFEVYDLFFTGYIAPGLTRSGLLTTTTQAFFGFSGIGAFVAATFAGLFVGTFFLGFLADRFGRRSIFTWALLAYTAASVAMACQTTSGGMLLWRFIAGIGIGVEIITIDAYITELVPSWMRGRAFEILRKLEASAGSSGARPQNTADAPPSRTVAKIGFAELFKSPYLSLVVLFMVFNFCQAFGFYGFANWVPTLLVEKGITVTKSLQYSFIVAFAYPIAPLLAASFADRLERKWIICGACVAIIGFGIAFSQLTAPALLILSGVMLTAANMTMSYAYHAYQTEVFPTAIRARASGLVYSMSRVSAMFSGFIVAYVLREAGVGGVFGLITTAMIIVIITLATFGPNVRGKPLDA